MVQVYNILELNRSPNSTLQFAAQTGSAPYIQYASNSMDYKGGYTASRWLNNAAFVALMYLNDAVALGVGTNDLTNANGQIVLKETTAPGLPSANHGTIFMEDNGAGKTHLAVKFPSGAKQVMATELPGVSADNGDAAATLTVGTSEITQRWNTAITADRAITLSTTGAYNGAEFHIVREAGATGAFNINVDTGPLKALAAPGEWCDVKFDGTVWRLVRYGSL